MVYEDTVYYLKGINEQLVPTLGRTTISIQIGERMMQAEFQVVHSKFPITQDGILGKPFIIGNQTIINYQTNELIVPDTSDMKIQARTETLIAIPVTEYQEGETLLIPAQKIAESIICSNTVNQVHQNQILVAVINPTESSVELTQAQTKSISIYKFDEVNVYTTQNLPETSSGKNRLEALREKLNLDHLNQEERESLMPICEEYSNIFQLDGDKLTCTDQIYHEIKTSEAAQPINVRPYRLPFKHRQEIDRQIQKLEEDNIIAPSKSPWNAPLLVVPKKPDENGVVKYRVCVDFRKLNQISTGDAYPLPNITEILDQLGKSKYYTTLDLAQGYHQVKMHPDHCHKTAFSTDKGHFEFLRVPFGLKGAPATFQRLMNSVLTGLNGIKAFVYLDDIIIYALNLEDHSRKLREVFDRLRESNLKLQPSKCSFMRKEVNYLGHVITDKGVRPNPQKIDCVVKFPTPTNAKEIKSFLGLSGYYRRFVPNYGQIAKPLTSLLKKDVPFYWSDLCQEAFDKLKAILTKEPLLKYPDFEQPFNLTCDASNFAIGCILSQGPIGNDPPIAYASRTLNKAEQNYNTTEKELCAIVWGVKQYRPYLYGQKFNIITDHRALSWLFNVKDPGSRLIRWRLKLEEYEYEIHYKPGANNTNADALSRIRTVTTRSKTKSELLRLEDSSTSTNDFDRIENTESPEISNPSEPLSNTEPSDDYQLFLNTEAKPTTNVIELTGNIFDSEPTTSLAQCVSADFSMSRGIALQMRRKFGHVNQLRQEQKSVTEVAVIQLEQRTIFYLITKEHHWQKSTYKSIYICLQKLKELCMDLKITNLACPRMGSESDGLQWEIIRNMLRNTFRNSNIKVCVYTREQLTEDQKIQKIRELHENPLGGHHGLTRTFNKLYEEHNWKGMRKQIKQFIRHCPDCQKNKTATRTPKEPMVITSTATRAFEKIFLDVVGPLPRTHSGNSFILTLQDDLTKFAWASPMENHEANTVAQHFVTKFVCLHGIPQSLVTDCGTEFLSNVFKEVCKLLKIRQTSTTPYHPQSNGSLERSHRSLAEYLRNFIGKDQLNWDTRIPYAMFCHNSTVHSATKFQPYHLVYGNSVKIPTSLTNEPEPQYNYNDYQYEVKRQMQEAQALARSNLLEAKSKSKEQYDKTAKHQSFEVGQKVLLQEKAPKNKLAPKWLGPYEILDVNPTNKNVTIKKSNKKNQTIHQNLLKLFHEKKKKINK